MKLKIYITTQDPLTVPKNQYWLDKLTDPELKALSFCDENTLKQVYIREYKGFKIIDNTIKIKVGRYTFRNGHKINFLNKVICTTNGKEYDSSSHAEKSLKLTINTVSKVCRGGAKQSGGYVFEYVK